jgi:hypothetical protein
MRYAAITCTGNRPSYVVPACAACQYIRTKWFEYLAEKLMVSFLLACGVVADRLHGSVVGNIVSQSQKYHRPLKKKEIMKVSCLS